MNRRRALIYTALAGLGLHAVALAVWGTRPPGPLFSNTIQFGLGVLAAIAATETAPRSNRFARQVWYLVAAALWIYTAGQALVIYYENVANLPLFSPWISDQFLFFWVVPLVVAAMVDPLEQPRTFDVAMLLDIAQVIIIAVALHVSVFSNPLNWQTNGQELAFLEWKVRIVRDGLVLFALFLRGVSSTLRQTRALFLRIAGFFLVYAVCAGIYLYVEALWELRSGSAWDLLWSVPRVLMVLIAATWRGGDEVELRTYRRDSPRRVLFYVVPVVSPLLVLVVGVRVVAFAPTVALLLIMTSLVLTAIRLLITQSRQQEAIKAVSVSEARYRSLFEKNRAGVFRSSPTRGVLDCNDAFAQMFGYTREEMIGMSPGVFYPGGATERAARMAELQKAGVLTDYELCYQRKDGTLLRAIQNVVLTQDENGEPVVEGTVVDVTERHNLEEQLRQSQKMEAIGRLAGGIAHDFNNLLTVISGYSQLLEEGLVTEPKMAGEARQIREAAERASMLTRQLLAFSRRQVLQPQAISLNTTLTSVEKLLHRLIGEDVELVTRYAPGLWAVRADPGQIEQVAMNLAVNARDAMPRGGTLTFETQNCPITSDDLREHPIMPPADYVRLTVTDTGTGMDPATRAQIFEPFFTTKKVGEGTGLGLSTVYGIVKQSGGFIWVDSEVGKGTTFRIYIPRIDIAAEQAKAAAAATARAAVPGRETVLLVEDDERVRGFAASVLQKSGYTVLVARDGKQAEAVNAEYSGEIHLLLADVVMPGSSGIEVAQAVRARRAAIKVLFMTGYSEDTHPWQGMPKVTDPILQKPFTPDALTAAIRSLLDGVAMNR